jgi:hypothetical protein
MAGFTITKFILIFSALSLCACTNKDLIGLGASRQFDEDSRMCTNQFQKATEMSTPFERQGRKVLLSAQLAASIQNGKLLSTGSHLVATVNTECEIGNVNGLKLKSKPLYLQRDISLEDLESWAQAQECLLGISNSAIFHTSYTLDNDPCLNNTTANMATTCTSELTHLKNIKAIRTTPGTEDGYDILYNPNTGVKSDVIIAIIDTGMDIDHNDLKNNLWVNTREIPGNNIDDDGNGYQDDINGYNFASDIANPRPIAWTDDPGGEVHGTHVAGLIGASANNGIGVAGVMGKNAKLMPLNIFGSTSGAAVEDLDNAIYYAADNGAKVINMSLGACVVSASTEVAVAYAIRKGAVIVTASGNEASEISDNEADVANCTKTTGKIFVTPGSYSKKYLGLVSVGSINVATNTRSSFSNYSNTLVEIAAPGSDSNTSGPTGLLSTFPGQSYDRLQGTSMSSPVVAGAIALGISLAKSRFGVTLTPAQAEYLLISSSPVNTTLMNYFKDGKQLDLHAFALKILTSDLSFQPNDCL